MEEEEGKFILLLLLSYKKSLVFFSDDGIQRDIKITQEIFGVITQYGNDFEVMRFTLKNTLPNGIKVQVMSLGAALVGVIAPDR